MAKTASLGVSVLSDQMCQHTRSLGGYLGNIIFFFSRKYHLVCFEFREIAPPILGNCHTNI